MARLYLFAPRCLVRDAWQALLAGNGHQVCGADGDPQVAIAELRGLHAELMLADLRWGCAPVATLLQALDEQLLPLRVLLLLPEAAVEPAGLRSLPEEPVWAWLPASISRAELLDSLDSVLQGRRQRPPWRRSGVASGVALSPLERRVLQDAAQGRSASAIARLLGLSPRTVSECRRQAMQRLGLPDAATLARYALRQGWIDNEASAAQGR